MKKLMTYAASALAASQMFVTSALALDDPNEIDGLATRDITNKETLLTAIVDVIKYVLDFVLIIAVVYVIISGIRLIISGGDEGAKDKAKQTIIYVIAGIIIVLFARVIVVAVNKIFTA